jgi:glutathione S-transferase
LDGAPVLWHLKVSHYNEKARWALDYKGVPHLRRAAEPGRHRAIAKRLSGGRTFPVLVHDGEAIGDSTRIIEALERRYPEPPLYPADPAERRRALELEDFFDEQLGPTSGYSSPATCCGADRSSWTRSSRISRAAAASLLARCFPCFVAGRSPPLESMTRA